jgi:hypothetical protein
MADIEDSGNQQPSGANANQTPAPAVGSSDKWPTRIGVFSLGIVAVLCIIALIFLSNLPDPPGTAPATTAQGDQPKEVGPVAA